MRDLACNGVAPNDLRVFRDAHPRLSGSKKPGVSRESTGLFGFLFTQRKFPRSAL